MGDLVPKWLQECHSGLACCPLNEAVSPCLPCSEWRIGETRTPHRNMLPWLSLLLLLVLGATPAARADVEGDGQCAPVAGDQPQLVRVAVLFRHGNRAALSSFPGDPNRDYEWPLGRGRLTKRGRRAMWALGAWLRARYGRFLSYDVREVTARSSPMPRCFDSAALVLYGLYPARTEETQWNPDQDWQPVDITRLPAGTDKYAVFCMPRYREALRVLSSVDGPCPDVFQRPSSMTEGSFSTVAEVIAYVAEKVGLTEEAGFSRTVEVSRILDAISVAIEYDLPVPEWASPHLQQLSWAYEQLVLQIGKSQMDHMAGALLRDVVAGVNAPESPSPSLFQGQDDRSVGTKVALFSYHDVTVAGALFGLNGTVSEKPQYGAAVILEIFTLGCTASTAATPKQLYASVFYKTGDDVSSIAIEGCDVPCPLEQFSKFLERRFKPVSREECGWSEHQPLL